MERGMTSLAILVFSLLSTWAVSSETKNFGGLATGRNGTAKALGLFSIVKFKNSACETSDKRIGTCYTAKECEERGGVPSGSCASSYGTCCSFSLECGKSVAENCTYFSGPQATNDGSCRVDICPCNDNICQLRLDFNRFSVIGPNHTPKGEQNELTNGGGHYDGTQDSALMICDTDGLAIVSPGHTAPPIVCGQNDGEHMYVEVGKDCTELNMFTDINTSIGRNWDIKITQIGCDSKLLAPQGCTQYFYNTDGTGILKTFNFDGGQHLGEQKQRFCIRRERGMCRVCYTVIEPNDFQITNSYEGGGVIDTSEGHCCGYDTDGSSDRGYDCVVIPGASTKSANGYDKLDPNEYCGNPSSGLFTSSGSDGPVTICSNRLPFIVDFYSDTHEEDKEYNVKDGDTDQPNAGMRLAFSQRAC